MPFGATYTMRDWLKAFLNLGRIARLLLHRTAETRRTQKETMSALTDLQAAVAANTAAVDAALAKLAQPGPDNSAELQAAATQLAFDAQRLANVVAAP